MNSRHSPYSPQQQQQQQPKRISEALALASQSVSSSLAAVRPYARALLSEHCVLSGHLSWLKCPRLLSVGSSRHGFVVEHQREGTRRTS